MTTLESKLRALVAEHRKTIAECPPKNRKQWQHVFEAVSTILDALEALLAERQPVVTVTSGTVPSCTADAIRESGKWKTFEYPVLAERQEPPREADWEAAAKQVDWMQILLNLMNGQETGRDGQPCFFIGGGRFCGRAKFWDGHIVTTDGALAHRFVSLLDLLTHVAAPSSGTGERK